ncbi:MAG: pyridoxal-phosphate dependent enzyme [Nitriliruptoraceae bacterium]|nr:pyridoxal-phosphate dependent enzyme [Nitriliruptoraceae bacterium]
MSRGRAPDGQAVLAALPVTLADVEAATVRIAPVVSPTRLVALPSLRAGVGREVHGKLEHELPTGSFKLRGAANRILALDGATAARGVMTASTGNHGRAVVEVARQRGIPATVFVSDHVPAGKLAALRASDAEVVVGGRSQTEALTAAQRRADERGATLVHPFLDPEVIAGQGTVGREILDACPDVGTILVPLSGGGLLAGILVAVRSLAAGIRVVGVCMDRGAAMATSLDAGRAIELPEVPTLADSLQGGIGGDDAPAFRIVRALVDEVVLVTEEEIWAGMRHAAHEETLELEGGGAVGIAALLAGRVGSETGRLPDGPVVVVCSGGNLEHAHRSALRDPTHPACPPVGPDEGTMGGA